MNPLHPRNPFSRKITKKNWVIPISMMMLVMGFMLALAWMTKENRSTRLDMLAPDQKVRLTTGTLDLSHEYEKLLAEVKKLREENTKFQNAMAKETGQARLLNESLQGAKHFAGLTEVEGPGVTITLRDYQGNNSRLPDLRFRAIHDTDILMLVNELWNAGADAVSVNNHRIVTGANFRCVGSVILVNNMRIAPPILIQVIGDPDTLTGALTLPGGILDDIRNTGHPDMVEVEKVKKMRLPAYGGSTTFKYSRLPKETK